MDTHTQISVGRVGTVGIDPILTVARYAVDHGISHERIENLIGQPMKPPGQETTMLPAIVGPLLLCLILEDGVGRAPSIEIAQKTPFSFFGGLERAIILAPTAREALKALSANFAVFHNRLIPAFDETKTYTHFSFRFMAEERDNGSCNEVVLCVLLRLMRSVFGDYGQAHEVRMRYTRNGEKSVYEDFFSCPIVYRSPDQSFGLVFKKTDLDWCQPGYDPEVFKFAIDRLSAIAASRREQSVTSDYYELINAAQVCAAMGVFKTAGIAAKAGIGERTAQRLAQRHGTSLGKLIDEARLKALREQLSRNPGTSAEDLSSMLGFSDSRAFRRALKTWTGQRLSDFREAHIGTYGAQ